MVSERRADGVEADSIPFGNQTGYRGMPGQVWGLPIWEFVAQGKR